MAAMSPADPTVTRRSAPGPTRGRSAPTAATSSTHHVAEPENTPSTSATAPGPPWATSPNPTNAAPNDRIVAGLVTVRPSVVT